MAFRGGGFRVAVWVTSALRSDFVTIPDLGSFGVYPPVFAKSAQALLIEGLRRWHFASVRKLMIIRGLTRRVHSLFVRFLFIEK
jgi:hypothetical protein